ncbi:MAG TPA: hypothetical protein PLP19_14845 [bacterium]|nr:hypothetical protein [bacterium]HPN44767.1 hypothetical protein [bacterium]
MKKLKLQIIGLMIIFLTLPGVSQDDMPRELPREYTSPDELCSLNGQLEFSDAMNILSEYSIQFAQKPIFDPTKQKGPIGIDINALHWEKALQIILSSRGLWYEKKEHFYQIVFQMSSANPASSESGGLPSDIRLRPGSREIKIETIFFEGDRKMISEIGIDWTTFYNGKVSLNADQVGALSVNESFLSVSVTGPSGYDVDIRALLNVFDSNNIGKVLAQPQVVVTEGNEGKIQVGQDFSIKTKDFAGNLIDRFFSTGTILQVTPYLITDSEKGEAIMLKAHVERSNAKPDVVSTIINKSEANSYIQLFDGEETLIAGLYNTENNVMRKGIPILKDLPPWFFGLCYLFGYNRTETAQKELIIIIKASILPDVFDRNQAPINQNLWDPEAELKLEQFKKGNISPAMPQRQINSSTDKKSDPATNSIQRQAYTPPPQTRQVSSNKQLRSEAMAAPQTSVSAKAPVVKSNKPVIKTDEPVLGNNYFVGTILTVEDNIIIIKWDNDFDTEKIFGKRFSIVRVNDTKKAVTVGQALIQETKYDRTIARKIKGNIQPGDLIVVKFSSQV